jgi:hypothetical protein
MKKMTFLVPAIVVLVAVSIAATAITPQKVTHKATQTFYYILKQNGDPLVESDYTTRVSNPPLPCGGDQSVCWIAASDNGSGLPDIDNTLEDEINFALDHHTDTDNVKLRD